MTKCADRILCVLGTLRLNPVAYESEIKAAVSSALASAGIKHGVEIRLGKRNRIDFLCVGGVGIEVKKGKPPRKATIRQVERYCSFSVISELILVVERNLSGHPLQCNGKRVHYLALSKLWGIAL